MALHPLCAALRDVKACFDRSTACLREEDSGFAPAPRTFTVAQHVAHVARTIDWFVDGAFSPAGFDLDFAAHQAAVLEVGSLAEARARLDRAVARAVEILAAKTPAELEAPIAAGPVLGGAPRSAIVAGITDHTAHHRGALTVCARLLGRTPEMPYA